MDERYPELYLEALAYHEAGHAVMSTLLGVPIEKVVIGPRCTLPDHNGKVFVAAGTTDVPVMLVVLLEVASEPAEKLAPSFRQFATLHKVYPTWTRSRSASETTSSEGSTASRSTTRSWGTRRARPSGSSRPSTATPPP